MSTLLPRTGLRTGLVTGTDESSAAEFNFAHSWLETQGIGALLAIGAGVKSGFEVTAASGLNVSISAGIAIAADTTLGAVLLQKSGPTSLLLEASDTWYIFAQIEDSETNVSQTSGVPLFIAQDSDTLDGAVLLARVVTGVSSITSVNDLRAMDGSSLESAFTQDTDNTAGLDFAYFGGLVQNGASVAIIANGDVTLADDATNYVEVDADGVVSANTSGWTSGQESLYEVVTAGGEIVTVTERRPDLHLGGDGVGTITEITSTDTSFTVTDGTGPIVDLSLADDAATDAKIGERTVDDSVTPASDTGELTDLLSGLAAQVLAVTGETNWYDAPAATLDDVATHVADADPHAGVLPLDGSRGMIADMNMGGFEAVNAATPTTANSYTTKAYVDGLIGASTPPLLAADVATTANIALTGSQTIDAVAVGTGTRVLVWKQTTQSENGVYDANSGGAWTRATDADTVGELPAGIAISVMDGAFYGGHRFAMISTLTTIDTDPMVWTLDSSGVGTGEANTISNAGTEGVSLVEGKAGIDLQVRGVVSMNALLTVAYNAATKAIRFTLNEASLALNNLSGTLSGTKGGTGHSTTAPGDLLTGAAGNTWAKLAANGTASRRFLMCVEGVLSWASQILGSDIQEMIASGATHRKGVIKTAGATRRSDLVYWSDDRWGQIPGSEGSVGVSTVTSVTVPSSLPATTALLLDDDSYYMVPGMKMLAVLDADPTVWIFGTLLTYTAGTVNIQVEAWGGSGGPYTGWTVIANTGPKGVDGAAGSTAWGDITGTPTTLAGYGITDAATDAEVAAALAGKASTSHTHDASDINAGTLDAARLPATAQLTTNLSNDMATDTGSTTKYPSVAEVEDYVAANSGSATLDEQLVMYVQVFS